MLTIFRNLLIGIGGLFGATLVAALVQGAVGYAAPAFSDLNVGATNVGTYTLLVGLGGSFFVVGAVAPRWLKTAVPLVWLLLPVVAVFVVALVVQPYVYRCNPVMLAACRVMLSPFAVSAAAVFAGYWFQRRSSLARAGA